MHRYFTDNNLMNRGSLTIVWLGSLHSNISEQIYNLLHESFSPWLLQQRLEPDQELTVSVSD